MWVCVGFHVRGVLLSDLSILAILLLRKRYPFFSNFNCVVVVSSLSLADDVYRESYMSVHVLLNLLNELGKRDKLRGLPSILSLFRNEFTNFNNTRARMLDFFYHMTLSIL